MTIRFASPEDLKQALDQVAVQKVGTEELTASGCVLIEQLEFDCTQVTTLEPGKATFRRFIHHTDPNSGGTSGTKFLADYASFKAKLNQMKEASASSLTLQLVRGTLKLRADLSVVNGKERERGNLSCKLYPGATSDFRALSEATTELASVAADQFSLWVSLLSEFGDFTSESVEGMTATRTVVVSLGEGTIEGVTNNKNAYGAYLRAVMPAQISTAPVLSEPAFVDSDDDEEDDDHEDEDSSDSPLGSASNASPFKFAIEGKYLKRLSKLTSAAPIAIYRSGNWITFKGDIGSVTLRSFEPSFQLLRDYQLFTPDKRWVKFGQRGVQGNDLSSAVAMQGQTEGGRADLALIEKIPNLVVVPAQNITGSDCAYVNIDPSLVELEWQPIVASSLGLKAALKVLRQFATKLRLTSTTINLEQKYVQRPSGNKTWLLYLETAGAGGTPESVTCLLFARDLTTDIDLLDTDE